MEPMTLTEFERKLYEYKASKHNVSDDDRLKETIKSAPLWTKLTVIASDHAGHYHVQYEKYKNAWLILKHFHWQKDSCIPDNMVAHDLTWILRLPNARITTEITVEERKPT